MAENVPEDNSGETPIPPRIKLNGNGKPAPPPVAPAPPPVAPAPPPVAPAPPPSLPIQPKPAGKSETSRIELSEARPANAADLAKKTTARIESPAPPVRVVSEVERMRAAAKGPAQKAKSATAPIPKISIPDLDAAKKQTARIDLKEVLGGDEDIFKRRTAILDPSKIQAAEAAAAPKTIRIKRPEGAATGLIKPVSEPMTPSEPIAAEARKSETARIELPQEVAEATGAEAPTRRKTIRIKRPEGGPPTARPLVVSKPSVAVSRAEPGAPTGAPTEEEAGTVFSIVALAAVLVACVLIYVLAAQVGTLDTLIPPHMPFPGGV